MIDIQEFQEGQTYPKETQFAVRYGYFYRRKAEQEESGKVHACLGDSPEILLWIANALIGGVVYDVIKNAVKKLYQKMLRAKQHVDTTTEEILTDESKLNEFCTYVMEFYEHRITANGKQIRYIREEIIADFNGNEVGEFYNKKKRLPTIEEYQEIDRNAQRLADELLKKTK